jgi:hypothetical protein
MRQRDLVLLAMLFFYLSAVAIAQQQPPWQAFALSCTRNSGGIYRDMCTRADQFTSIMGCLSLRPAAQALVRRAGHATVNDFMEDKRPPFCLSSQTIQIQDQDLAAKLKDFKLKSAAVTRESTNYEHFTYMKNDVMKLNRDNPSTLKVRQTKEEDFKRAVKERDDAADKLAGAINKAMENSQSNQELGKQLEKVYDEVQATNKTTNDAELMYDETLALLDEQAATDDRAKQAAADTTNR